MKIAYFLVGYDIDSDEQLESIEINQEIWEELLGARKNEYPNIGHLFERNCVCPVGLEGKSLLTEKGFNLCQKAEWFAEKVKG